MAQFRYDPDQDGGHPNDAGLFCKKCGQECETYIQGHIESGFTVLRIRCNSCGTEGEARFKDSNGGWSFWQCD